jgi:hypothetical protein
MKQFLLLFIVTLNLSSFAQNCTPDTQLQDSTYGIWPDTIVNLAVAPINTFYSEEIQIKTPTTVSEVPDAPADYNGLPIGQIQIQNIELVDIFVNGQSSNLPSISVPGNMQIACSTNDCAYPGNSVGCVSFYGTPTVPGTYDLSIAVDGSIQVFGGSVSLEQVTGDFIYIEGYKLIVDGANNVELVKPVETIYSLKNVPNPFENKTTVYFDSKFNQSTTLEVFNALGVKVSAQSFDAQIGKNEVLLNLASQAPGVYFYTLSNNSETVTKRMLLSNK